MKTDFLIVGRGFYGAVLAERIANILKKEGINFVAIMSNDTKNYPDDSFENMVKFAKENHFNFN